MDGSDLARIAGLFADPARARILRTLIDGTLRPAGEFAFAANISAQSASAHLAKLVEGGLLELQAQGRHRYFRISNPEVADAVESLGSLGEALRPRAPRAPALPKAAPAEFLRTRTCYDHLAGETAVQVCAGMLNARWLVAEGRDFRLTQLGSDRLAALGVDVEAARHSRRAFARACVDLTQRRPHIGGALGAVLLEMYLARGWILRMRRSRAVGITPKGSEGFGQALGMSRERAMAFERAWVKVLAVLLFAYASASLVHHAHNAVFLADYPNMPAWITRPAVYVAWLGETMLGAAGYLILRRGHLAVGIGLIAIYAALGFDAFGHYALAPAAAHTAAMNATIWLEAAAAALVFVALAALARRP